MLVDGVVRKEQVTRLRIAQCRLVGVVIAQASLFVTR